MVKYEKKTMTKLTQSAASYMFLPGINNTRLVNLSAIVNMQLKFSTVSGNFNTSPSYGMNWDKKRFYRYERTKRLVT